MPSARVRAFLTSVAAAFLAGPPTPMPAAEGFIAHTIDTGLRRRVHRHGHCELEVVRESKVAVVRSILILAAMAMTLSCSAGRKAADHKGTAEEAAALEAVQRFFDTMASKDVAGATAVLDPEGSFVSVRWSDDGQRVVRRRSNRDYLDGLAAEKNNLLERMWDSDVQVHGPIATVRTPYDFYIDGVFSHCGIDMFQLLHTDGGWIITGGTYTVERTDCPKSPLGPPGK